MSSRQYKQNGSGISTANHLIGYLIPCQQGNMAKQAEWLKLVMRMNEFGALSGADDMDEKGNNELLNNNQQIGTFHLIIKWK